MVVEQQRRKRRRFTSEREVESESVSEEMIIDWASGLPVNLYDSILDRLPSLGDYVRFGAVCKSWLGVSLEQRNHRCCPRPLTKKGTPLQITDNNHNHHLPLLMLPGCSVMDKGFFYSATTCRQLDFQLSVPYGGRFIGSSFGWLISVQKDFSITLFNPFSNNKLCLPPILPDPANKNSTVQEIQGHVECYRHEYFFPKAILSADPNLHPNDCILMVIYSNRARLAYIRPQPQVRLDSSDTTTSNSWVYLNRSLQGFSDIIYSNGLFYALHHTGRVYSVVNLHNAIDPVKRIGPLELHPDPSLLKCFARYIVESCDGAILQVLRYSKKMQFGEEFFPKSTSDFRVFKLDMSTQPSSWIELESLEDQVLFLGDNSSLSVLASNCPGCYPGSIYFTWGYQFSRLSSDFNLSPKEYGVHPPDVGMFSLKYRQFVFNNWNNYQSYAMYNRPPIWIVPTFQAPVLRNPDCPSAKP